MELTHAIPYGKQDISDEDIKEVVEVLKSDYLTQGPKVEEFECEFAKYVGSKFGVAVSNGTAALHLSNLAMGTSPGQKVITTPITFAASANSVLYCGGEIDFVDIDHETFVMDLTKFEYKLRSRPLGTYSGIIPVDFTGLPVDTEKLRELADEFNLWIIEDACHSPGAYYINSKGKPVSAGNGYYSDLTCFSFHPVKHIAAGEGGMITTNDELLYQKLLTLRTHGISKKDMVEDHGGWYYEMHELGYNYRLADINAALGRSQLNKAGKGLKRRREIAENYFQAFKEIGQIKTQRQPENAYNAFHLFVIQIEKRKELYNSLREKQIFAQVHYVPVHLLHFYQKLGWKKGDFPIAEKYYESSLSLPMYPSLTEREQNHVIETVIRFFR